MDGGSVESFRFGIGNGEQLGSGGGVDGDETLLLGGDEDETLVLGAGDGGALFGLVLGCNLLPTSACQLVTKLALARPARPPSRSASGGSAAGGSSSSANGLWESASHESIGLRLRLRYHDETAAARAMHMRRSAPRHRLSSRVETAPARCVA